MEIHLSKTPSGDAPPPPNYLGRACKGRRDQSILHVFAATEDVSQKWSNQWKTHEMPQTYFRIRVGSRLFGDIGAALRFGRGRSGRPLLLKGAVLDPKSFYATIRSTWGPLWGHLWVTLGLLWVYEGGFGSPWGYFFVILAEVSNRRYSICKKLTFLQWILMILRH